MADLVSEYADLKFTKEQIFLSDDEVRMVAMDFWSTCPADLTDLDRAFIQGCLLIAADKSEKAGMLFDIYSSFVSTAPSQSVSKLVRDLAKRTAKRWFEQYLHKEPRINAAGKAAVQYSALTSEWKLRVGLGDTNELTNFLLQ